MSNFPYEVNVGKSFFFFLICQLVVSILAEQSVIDNYRQLHFLLIPFQFSVELCENKLHVSLIIRLCIDPMPCQ